MSQINEVYELMSERGGITPLDALKRIGCMRLGARIHELKKLGIPILTERVRTRTGKVVARYKLGE